MRGSRTSGGSLGNGFGRLLGANLTSSLADGIARTAAPLLALSLTQDPLLIAGVAAAIQIPWLVFALPSGVLIDRLDRRHMLAVASGTRSVLALGLFLLTATDTLTIWWLYGILLAYGAGETLADGAIRAMVPSTVDSSDLPRANSRIEAGEQVLQGFAAAPLASALFAVSALIPLGIDIAAFAIAAALALSLPLQASGPIEGESHEPMPAQLRAGLTFLLGSPMLAMLWFFSTFFAFCLTMASSLVPLYAVEELGLPEGLFGTLLLIEALGAVVATTLIERLRRKLGTGWAMAIANVVASSSLLLAWAIPQLWALAVTLFIYAGALSIWNVLIISLRQAAVPRHLLGRVHGTWRTLHWGIAPLGALLGGVIGRVEVALPFLVGGGASALVGLALARRMSRLPEPDDLGIGGGTAG